MKPREKARPLRTVQEILRALRFSSAEQQSLFFKTRKEKFLWEQSLIQSLIR